MAESNTVETNRIIKDFERRAKEAEAKKKGLLSKTSRLIEKFEKKATGTDDKGGSNGGGAMISNIKKMFEPGDADDPVADKPSKVIPAGSTNKLIERFQEPTTEADPPV